MTRSIGPLTLSRRLALACGLALACALASGCGGQEPVAATPVVPALPKDPAWLAGAARACAKAASCTRSGGDPRLRDPGACVEWWLSEADPQAPDPLRKCLAEAKTCDHVDTCVRGGGDARAAAFCAGRPGVVSGCDAERLVSCADDDAKASAVTDCTALGATCRELKSAGSLVIRACFSAQKCPPNAPEARCDGTGAVIACHDGAIERLTCSPGTLCRDHTDDSERPTASCQLPGSRGCERAAARRCESDRLVECTDRSASGRVHVSDCGALGLRCTGMGPRAGCYVPANVECDKEMLPKCEDGAIVFCAAGRLAKVSCSSLGMATCNPASRGPMAICAPAVQR